MSTSSGLISRRGSLAELIADRLDPPRTLDAQRVETAPDPWLRALFPSYVSAPLADHHHELWAWAWAIRPGERPEPFVAVWPRGGAKSTTAELVSVMWGARRLRRYLLYICGTQEQADDHVGNIGSLLESPAVAQYYPDLADRKVGKYGNIRGWRRSRLWTKAGFVVDAIGLDTAARGVKLEEQRPDGMIIDDIDQEHDTPRIVSRKAALLRKSLLPAGASDLAVLAVQNLIHADSIFARLVDGRADFLTRRRVSGPIPALINPRFESQPDPVDPGRQRIVITAGTPTWQGQDQAACQHLLDAIGLDAFRTECQHDVWVVPGALWSHEQINASRIPTIDPATLDKIVVGVDPSGGDEHDARRHDEVGIIVTGARDGHGYVLDDRSLHGSPHRWGRAVVTAALDWEADHIVAETNYGGAMVKAVIEQAAEELGVRVHVKVVTASRGKRQRAEPLAACYGDKDHPETWPAATFHHVGTFPELEHELCTWEPLSGASPNRLDALVWAGLDVMGLLPGKGRARTRYRGSEAA